MLTFLCMKSLNVATFAELPFIPRFNQKHFTEILHDPIEVFLMAERMESVVCISVLLQTHKYSDSVTYPSFLCGFNSTSVWSGADRICHCIRAVNGEEAEWTCEQKKSNTNASGSFAH